MAFSPSSALYRISLLLSGAILGVLIVLGFLAARGPIAGTGDAFTCASTFEILNGVNNPRTAYEGRYGLEPSDARYLPGDQFEKDFDTAQQLCRRAAVENGQAGALMGALPLVLFGWAARHFSDGKRRDREGVSGRQRPAMSRHSSTQSRASRFIRYGSAGRQRRP